MTTLPPPPTFDVNMDMKSTITIGNTPGTGTSVESNAPVSTSMFQTSAMPQSSSSRILTNKVQNAISLNTTTPSFNSALTALSTLKAPASATGTSGTTTAKNPTKKIDARSIRTAIEHDALYQAKCLEEEMRRLVHVVQDMRRGIKDVVTVAEGVKDGIREAVHVGNTNTNASPKNANDSTSVGVGGSSAGFEEERKLARLLAEAFQDRNEASQRYDAIHEFMERFDVSESDSQMMEHYNFENVLDENGTEMNMDGSSFKDGMEFLDALNRVSKIRRELESSSSGLSSTGTGLDNNDAASNTLAPASAIRMMENLASKQDNAFERLYHFLHSKLDLSHAAVANVPTSSSSAAAATSVMMMSHQSSSSSRRNSMIGNDGGTTTMDETLLHPFIKRSIVVLRQVPAYYRHTLELIATSRRAEVTRKFLLALTSGYDGMAPIEMKAHDPVNYVGDMLAFVFRTMSVESELAKGLVAKDEGDDDDNDDVKDESKNQEFGMDAPDDDLKVMSALDVLNDTTEGIARPLKSRISQVISSLARKPDDDDVDEAMGLGNMDGLGVYGGTGGANEEASTARIRLASLYSICGLLLFYHSAMEKALKKLDVRGSNSDPETETVSEDDQNVDIATTSTKQANPLVRCLFECIEEGANAYVASLNVYRAMLDSFSAQSRESQATIAHAVITRLCDVRIASPGFGIECHVPQGTTHILSLGYLYDTIIEAALPSCTSLDDAIMMKMALNAVKKVEGGMMEGSSSSDSNIIQKWHDILQEKEEAMVKSQIASDTNYVLDECGLGSIGNAIESMMAVYIEGMTASSHPGLSQDSLRSAIGVFYESLVDPPIPTYQNIKDPVLRKYARNKVGENVADMYKEIYELARSEKGGYEDLTFLKHDAEAVKSLLMS